MDKIFRGWWVAWGSFFLTILLGGAVYFGFTAFYDPIIQEFNWTYTEVSIAFSIRGLEMGLLAPVAGFLVDRYGPRVLILIGVSLIGMSLLFLSQVQSLTTFYAAFVLMAIGTSGCSSTVLLTAVAGWFRKNVGKAMGVVSAGFGVGGLMVAWIVYLIDVYKWRNAMIILGILVLVAGLPLAFVVGLRPKKNQGVPAERKNSPDSKAKPDEAYWPGIPFNRAIRSFNFWKLCFAETIRVANTTAILTHVMPYLASMEMPRYRAAWVATAIPLASVAGRMFYGWLCDRLDKKLVWISALALLSLGNLLFVVAYREEFTLLFIIIYSTAFGGAVTVRGAILREYFGAVSFGRLHGIVMGLAAAAGIVGVTGSAWVFDTFKDYRPVWLFFVGAVILAALMVMRIKKDSAE